MNKNILLPISIIAVALLIGGAVLFSGQNKDASIPAYPDSARVLTLSIPGMVCAGCAASVEGYVKAMPGVLEASVTLATKSGTFLYDPSKITKGEIVKNTIFDIYTPVIVSDEPYDPAKKQIIQSPSSVIPITIQEKSNQIAQLLAQKRQTGKVPTNINTKLSEVNAFIEKGQYQAAENLLDDIINELKKL